MSAKHAVVTGGGSGIGRAIAIRLASDGANVSVWDWNGDSAQETALMIADAGGTAKAHAANCADREQIRMAAARSREAFGPVRILINNAGISDHVKFPDMTEEQWDRMIAINLKGPFLCTKEILPDMLEAQWGRIVNISSSSFQLGTRSLSHYCASKGGVIGLTRALAIELAETGVTVNTIPPNFCDTPMLRAAPIDLEAFSQKAPMKRPSKPEELAAACAFIVSDDANFITGQAINVNGGAYLGL